MKKYLKIPSFQETLNKSYCGPASLKIVLQYHGCNIPEKKAARLIGVTRELGCTPGGIARTAKRLGFKITIKEYASFSDIYSWLKKGVPLIVGWFTRGSDNYPADTLVPAGHYSVVCGLDDTHIYLQDPEIGSIRKLEREAFKSVWFDYKGRYISPKNLIVRSFLAIYK